MSQSRGVLAVLACVLLLGGCATAHHSTGTAAGARPTSTAPVGTVLRTFVPYLASGRPAAAPTAHRSGSCFTSSITVASVRAFRCFAANAILDPCLVAPGSRHQLDCYADPWSHPVQLRVARLPHPAAAAHISRPWAVELADGTRCVVTNGTATILRGVALGYGCAHGAAGLSRTTGRVLTALYRDDDGAVRTVRVATAWRPAAA